MSTSILLPPARVDVYGLDPKTIECANSLIRDWRFSRVALRVETQGITKAVKGVIYRNGIDQEIDKIKTPTLILSGEFDSATVPEYSRKMNEQIQSSEWKVIPGAGHSSTIENPQKVIENMDGFLKNIRSSSEMQSSL